MKIFLQDDAATQNLGAKIAKNCLPGCVIYLQGELGAGKTTLVRGFLYALGHTGAVKSPTYTLVESYECDGKIIHHFDFYRVHNPLELEHVGLSDYLIPKAIVLIEWPENAGDYLPAAIICCRIGVCDEGRWVTITTSSERGEQLIGRLQGNAF